MNRKQITYFNLFSIVCVVALLIVGRMTVSAHLLPLQALITFYVVLVLPGVNITYVIEGIARRSYDLAVFANISLLTSIFIPPFFLVGFYQLFNSIDIFLALAAYMMFMLLPYLWHMILFGLKYWIGLPKNTTLFFPKISWRAFVMHPLFIVLVIVALVHLYNLTRYSFLPVPDSYSWLIDFESKLPIHKMPVTTDPGRRSFSAFISAFFYMSRINLYHLFKYVLPFLSLLAIAPLWLAARQLPNNLFKILFLLAGVFISPTVILEFEFIRQQVIFLLFLYFFVGLQIYAIDKKDTSIFYLLGILSLFGTAIHPAFLILALTWIISFILSHIKILWRHKNKFLLLAVLAFPLAERVHVVNMFVRIREQASGSWGNFISGNWNMRFPTYYVSVDGYEMSWPGLAGLFKYYSFYAGPVAFFVLFSVLMLIFFSKTFRKKLLSLLARPAFLNMFIPLLLFFGISDIAPRFGNIAFLPDRAWQYLSILLILPFFLVLAHVSRLEVAFKKIGILTLFFFASMISIFGAVYVNNFTKYTMPDYEFVAVEWIRNNIDNNSYLYSSSSKNLIRYHTQTTYVGFGSEFYVNLDKKIILNHMSSQIVVPTNSYFDSSRISALFGEIADVSGKSKIGLEKAITYNKISTDTFDYLAAVSSVIQLDIDELLPLVEKARQIQIENQFQTESLRDIYIYYAKTHPKNPYATRPYDSSFTVNQNLVSFPSLDGNPDIFVRVYEDGNNVIIWQVLN